MPILTQVEAMVIRGCSAVLSRVGGVQAFSTIRGASGPIRYNPQTPGSAKPTRGENREGAGVSHSRPLQRWKRAPKKVEEWGLGNLQEQKSYWDRQEEVGEAEKDQSFASAEILRLKAEMKLRDSSIQSSAQLSQVPAPFPHKREKIHPVAEEEQALKAETSPSRSKQDASSPSSPTNLEAVSVTSELGRIPAVEQNQTFGEGLFFGDGRKFEGLDTESSNWNRQPSTSKIKSQLQGSGLFYGDGRKFEGLLPDANDPFDDSFRAAGDNLFETTDAEEDKKIVKEKQAAKNYALRLLGFAGLQSDLEYAEAFARSRWRSSIWGPQRLKQELRQRGVCPDDIDTALQKVFTTTDVSHHDENSEENEGRWGMTKEASDHLFEKARLQWGRGGNISAEARKRRMIGWLQRRGFNWSITLQILKSLESQVG